MTINSAKPTDTADLIMGAGSTGFSWYRGSERSHIWDRASNPYENWHVTLLMEDINSADEDDNIRVTLDHKAVMKQARYVVANKGKMRPPARPGGKEWPAWSQALERECTNLVFNVDACDFDAASADELIQLAAYGEVVFG